MSTQTLLVYISTSPKVGMTQDSHEESYWEDQWQSVSSSVTFSPTARNPKIDTLI